MPTEHWRPSQRLDCRKVARPCCFVGCRYNLFLDVTARGGLRIPFGEEPEALAKMPETCALDVAERGGMTLEQVAQVQALTRERVRQIEVNAMKKLQAYLARQERVAEDRLLRSRDNMSAEGASGKAAPVDGETPEQTLEQLRELAAARRQTMQLFLSD